MAHRIGTIACPRAVGCHSGVWSLQPGCMSLDIDGTARARDRALHRACYHEHIASAITVTSCRHSSAPRRGSAAHAHADHCAPNIPYRAIAVSLRDTAGWKPIALCLGSDSPAVLLPKQNTPRPVVRITPSRVPCGRSLCRSPSCAPPQHHIAPAPTTPRHGAPISSRVPCS